MKKEYDIAAPCPCWSGQPYEGCCRPFHQGASPDTALQLMRSRYAAYALCLPNYIIQTTHPDNPQFDPDRAEWTKKISTFSSHTEFRGLEILGWQEEGLFATVTFFAQLLQEQKEVSFTEKSYFEKVKGRWLYRSGQFSPGRAP